MVLQDGSRVLVQGRHLSSEIKAAIKLKNNNFDIDSLEVQCTVVERLAKPARGWKVTVDGGHGVLKLSTKELKEVHSPAARPIRQSNNIDYGEDGYVTEADIGNTCDEDPSDGDQDSDDLDPLSRHDAAMGRPGRPCRGPRDGPITAANARIEDCEKMEGIIVDQRDKSMRKGRLMGDCMEDLSQP
jgi:hypothetical protein